MEATPYRDDALQKWGSHVRDHALHHRINISVMYGITWHIHGSPCSVLFDGTTTTSEICCSAALRLRWCELFGANSRLMYWATTRGCRSALRVSRRDPKLRCNTQQCCSANELHCRVLQCSKWAVSHVAVTTLESCRVCWYVYTYVNVYHYHVLQCNKWVMSHVAVSVNLSLYAAAVRAPCQWVDAACCSATNESSLVLQCQWMRHVACVDMYVRI